MGDLFTEFHGSRIGRITRGGQIMNTRCATSHLADRHSNSAPDNEMTTVRSMSDTRFRIDARAAGRRLRLARCTAGG